MKVEFVKSSYTVYEVVKVDNEYKKPRVECNLTCKCHYDMNTSDFILNGIYGSDVLRNIEDRLGQAGYSSDFIARVIIGKEFTVYADTVLHEGDEFNEALGRHIAETKARTKVFKILSIFSEELEKYYRKAIDEVTKLNSKNNYLFNREKEHLFTIGGVPVNTDEQEVDEQGPARQNPANLEPSSEQSND